MIAKVTDDGGLAIAEPPSRTKAKRDRRAARRGNGRPTLDMLPDGELRGRLIAMRSRVYTDRTLRPLTRTETEWLQQVEDRGLIGETDHAKAVQVLGFYEPTAAEIVSDIANGRRVPDGKHAAAIDCASCGTDIVAALQSEQASKISHGGGPAVEAASTRGTKGRKSKPGGSRTRPQAPATGLLPTQPMGIDPPAKSIEQCFVGEREIGLSLIEPDHDQPRKHFDDDSIIALADSIAQHGLLQPLGVEQWSQRPKPRKGGTDYEPTFRLVWGERRFHAAGKAGRATVRCRVYEGLTTEQRRELQLVENDQRTDLNPIERAEAYARMNEPVAEGGCGLSLDAIAAKLGAAKGEPMSKGYVSGQIKLLQLIPDARKKLIAGELPVNTAIALARINDPESQARCWRDYVWRPYADQAASLRSVQDNIRRLFVRSLKSAPFDPTDATLSPKAGACTACPFRDAEANTCTKLSCYSRKRQAHERSRIAKLQPAAVLKQGEALGVFKYSYSSSQRPQVEPDSKYVDLDAKCPHGPKGKTWRQVLGEHTPAPIVAKDPNDDKKRLIQLATKADAYAALKLTAHKWAAKAKPAATRSESSNGRDDYAAKEKARKAAAAIRVQVIERAIVEIHAHTGEGPRSDHVDYFRLVAAKLARALSGEAARLILKSHAYVGRIDKFIQTSGRATLESLVPVLIAMDHAGLDSWDHGLGHGIIDVAKLYRVDLKKITAEVKAAEKTAGKKLARGGG